MSGVTVSKNELERELNKIKAFMNELDSLQMHLGALNHGGICEIGSKFLDDHIELLSKYVGDEGNWLNWHIWDNDFGKGQKLAGYDGKLRKIDRVSRLWDLIEESKKRA